MRIIVPMKNVYIDLKNKVSNLGKEYISMSQMDDLKKSYLEKYKIVKKSFYHRILYYPFIKLYNSLEKIISDKNKTYIANENKKYKNFFNDICGYPLDQNQRDAIIIDDDKNLIVAGAGSGKSLTIIGKIHYLIFTKEIKEQDILCISFTNEATRNLKNKLKEIYNYDIDVYTFHKLGYEIIKNEKKNIKIVSNSILEDCINQYFKNLDRDEIINVLKYFSEFTKIPREYKVKNKHITLKSICENIEEYAKDKEEVEISNILYIKGIIYTYESTSYGAIFHLSKKIIYYYNFYNPLYALLCIDENNTGIHLYKFNLYNEEIIFHIEKILKDNHIDSFPLDYQKVYMDMLHNRNDYIISLKKLLSNFMNIYKSGTKSINDLENEIKKNTIEFSFFHIFKEIYEKYQNKLRAKNEIDMNDMLLLATKLTQNQYRYKPYKYILIDEFQDTSLVRYALIHNIIKHTNAKLIAVGDDFQSIYRFSGCSVDLFIHFEKYFGASKISYIENTYRNSQELIDVAGTFIMKNPSQIKKKLYSNKHVKHPIEIYYYDNLSTELLKILNTLSTGKSKIILGRNNKDINLIEHNQIKIEKDCIYCKTTKEKIPYLTVHKSKGLEYDYVFLINMVDGINGIPSKIKEHSILKLVLPKEEKYPYAEERRLFYVALTRAKEKVFILSPKKNSSIFVKEIEDLMNRK